MLRRKKKKNTRDQCLEKENKEQFATSVCLLLTDSKLIFGCFFLKKHKQTKEEEEEFSSRQVDLLLSL